MTAVASRNVILVKGRVVFDGDSATLRGQPGLMHRYLRIGNLVNVLVAALDPYQSFRFEGHAAP